MDNSFPAIKPIDNIMLAYHHKQPYYIPSIYTDMTMFKPYPELERYCGTGIGTDGFGVEWRYEPTVGAPMTTQNHQIDCITDWKKVKFPDLDAIDWEKQAELDAHRFTMGGPSLFPLEHNIFENHDKCNLAMVINGPFERMHSLEGFDNALCDLLMEPEACADYFKAIAEWKAKCFHKIATHYPVDVINGHDDYGSAHNLFMSLETWRTLIKPNLAMMVEQVHKDGIIYQHHTCGYCEPLIEDFIEIGIDALDVWQGGSNPNMGELKKKYGDKITFCGGFDNQFLLDKPDCTEEEARAEYRKVIDMLAPGGSYIVFPLIVNKESGKAFADEHFKYGMDFYKRNGVSF